MATVITEECINCGACEPECPNTAIYQGGVEWELDGQKHSAISASTFYIVPDKCTECVGFYDHEACAAVCPVDCCVPDPKIPETEDVLIVRAKKLHPDVDFGASFPSRFRKEGPAASSPTPAPTDEAALAPPAAPIKIPAVAVKPVEPAAPAAAVKPAAPASPAAAAAPAKPAPPADTPAPKAIPTPVPAAASAPAARAVTDTLSIAIPALEEWDVPISCFRCGGEYTVAFRYFRPGVVFYCPHCTGSFVATSSVYNAIAGRLRKFHQSWARAFEDFREKRQREIEAFEVHQRSLLAAFEKQLKAISREVTPPGAPPRRRSIFG